MTAEFCTQLEKRIDHPEQQRDEWQGALSCFLAACTTASPFRAARQEGLDTAPEAFLLSEGTRVFRGCLESAFRPRRVA